jgi:FixJ family two-component response regulator
MAADQLEEAVVFVVDDDESVRHSLRRLLSSVGLKSQLFASAQAFLDAPRWEASGCLVLDVQLPDLSGLDVQRRLIDRAVPLPIVFLTGHGDIPMSVRAIKAGAVEFLTKPFRPTELIAAIRSAIQGDSAARREREQLADLRRRYDSLTPREQQVMAGVAAGRLNKQIAADFGTKEVTVKEQRGQVMLKMRAVSAADLVRAAARLGIDATAEKGPPPKGPPPR